jgi:PAS domain S-box-containing protein
LEEKILENHNNLVKQYFDFADAFMVAIDSDEIVTDINRKGCEILGYQKNKILGKNWFSSFVPKEKREETRILFHNMLKGSLRHIHYEHPLITKKGKKLVYNWHNVLASNEKGKTIGTLSMGADVTEIRKKEERAKEVENRLQISIDNMLEGCQIIDYDWRYAYLNEAAAKQGRRGKEDLLGKTMMEAYPGIDKTEMFSHLRNCMTNRVPHQMENEFTFPDGSKGWFELHIEPVPEGVLILSLDITKNKEIEAEINRYRNRLEAVVAERTSECAKTNEQLSREIYQHKRTEEGLKLRATILDNATEAIFLVNMRGDFMYANKASTKTYGYTLDEFLNMNLKQLLKPEDAKKIESRLKEADEKGQVNIETIHLRKNKTPLAVQVQHNLIKTEHGKFIVTVIRELTM